VSDMGVESIHLSAQCYFSYLTNWTHSKLVQSTRKFSCFEQALKGSLSHWDSFDSDKNCNCYTPPLGVTCACLCRILSILQSKTNADPCDDTAFTFAVTILKPICRNQSNARHCINFDKSAFVCGTQTHVPGSTSGAHNTKTTIIHHRCVGLLSSIFLSINSWRSMPWINSGKKIRRKMASKNGCFAISSAKRHIRCFLRHG
jgi:hypothetical protein